MYFNNMDQVSQQTKDYIDKFAAGLVQRNLDGPHLQFTLDKLFDSCPVTCVVSHYDSPEDIGQLVMALRDVESLLPN